ncbi:MAG: hypothetical protein ACM3S4_04760 [Burkholderiales bacterium]
MYLQIRCPKCGSDMNSTCELIQGPKDKNTIHLMEFEGLEFRCEDCEHEVCISSVNPRDIRGIDIY